MGNGWDGRDGEGGVLKHGNHANRECEECSYEECECKDMVTRKNSESDACVVP